MGLEEGGRGWHRWGWILLSFQTCTMDRFESYSPNTGATERLGVPDLQTSTHSVGHHNGLASKHVLNAQTTWTSPIND